MGGGLHLQNGFRQWQPGYLRPSAPLQAMHDHPADRAAICNDEPTRGGAAARQRLQRARGGSKIGQLLLAAAYEGGIDFTMVDIDRLSRGVPIGSELEFVDLGTIAHALLDRRNT